MVDLGKAFVIIVLSSLALASISLGQSASPDLNVKKYATSAYSFPMNDGQWSTTPEISEVGPSEMFYYLVRINNPQDASAEDAVVRDWLPYEVTNVTVLEPKDGVSVQGNLVEVDLPTVPPQSSRYIVIQVVSPQFAPTSLYNYVNIRYRDDINSSNDRDSTVTHVRPLSYTKQDATASYEDLLRSQSDLLAGFEDALNSVATDQKECYQFIASCEQLLRSQTVLFSRFQELLYNSSGEGWDDDFLVSDQIAFLASYEDLLRREAGLYAGFSQKLDHCWNALGRDYRYDPDGPGGIPEHSAPSQREFLSSFEDLLRRQAVLYDGFQKLESRLDESVVYEDRVKFLSSFEDLLRRESNLLQGFEDLIMRLFLSI